ncbi:MAG: GNAT family N-acetyltransferase [Bacteroidales bacterium]|nr:GNAT family N-acetyltransferase [Bacteroidales bacterium]
MQIEIVKKKSDRFVKDAVKLHIEALSYRSFITELGFRFLYKLYTSIFHLDLGFLIVASVNNKLKGFILATEDSDLLFKVIIKRFYIFIPLIIMRILRKPQIIIKLIQTILYNKKVDINIKSELVVIAVDNTERSKGMGREMLNELSIEFLKRNITEYKVTVHEEMHKSNNFYLKNSFLFLKSFSMYGVIWNLYSKKIK